MLVFYSAELFDSRLSPKLKNHPFGCPQYLFNISSYLPYLEAISSIHNLMICLATITGTHITWLSIPASLETNIGGILP
jgi:hypothetical protein